MCMITLANCNPVCQPKNKPSRGHRLCEAGSAECCYVADASRVRGRCREHALQCMMPRIFPIFCVGRRKIQRVRTCITFSCDTSKRKRSRFSIIVSPSPMRIFSRTTTLNHTVWIIECTRVFVQLGCVLVMAVKTSTGIVDSLQRPHKDSIQTRAMYKESYYSRRVDRIVKQPCEPSEETGTVLWCCSAGATS